MATASEICLPLFRSESSLSRMRLTSLSVIPVTSTQRDGTSSCADLHSMIAMRNYPNLPNGGVVAAIADCIEGDILMSTFSPRPELEVFGRRHERAQRSPGDGLDDERRDGLGSCPLGSRSSRRARRPGTSATAAGGRWRSGSAPASWVPILWQLRSGWNRPGAGVVPASRYPIRLPRRRPQVTYRTPLLPGAASSAPPRRRS